MIKHKDNFTDAVEALDKNRDNASEPQVNDRQVVDNDGEIVTLGQKKPDQVVSPNKHTVVELLSVDNKDIVGMIKNIMVSSLKEALKKIEKKFGGENKKSRNHE